MESQFVEFSLVVLANDHNPTILNPDFLLRNQIVDNSWEWNIVGQPITTPGFSTVAYDSNVTVTVEPVKLQVTETSKVSIEDSHICEAVSNYVKALSQVQYTAVGINFTQITYIDDEAITDEVMHLIDRFLKDGEWNTADNQLQGIGLKFLYEIEGGVVTISIDKGSKPDIDRPFIVTQANFHRGLNVAEMPTSDRVLKHLEGIKDDWDKFQDLYNKIIRE